MRHGLICTEHVRSVYNAPSSLHLQSIVSMFGYARNELEGANISMLMPQPFSQRRPSYLQRYTSTGEPHILDSVREVVALHKVGGDCSCIRAAWCSCNAVPRLRAWSCVGGWAHE